MDGFAYFRVQDPADAAGRVQRDAGAAFLAGGTGLIDLMKLHVETPKTLVDVGRLPLSKIEPLPNGLRIGAMVRNSDLAYDERVRKRFPALSEALLAGASPQIRNMATVGGNLLQRTRCEYFRDVAFACNKRSPGSGCDAMEGYNRMHAILGVSDKCIATHASDMCVALAALDAVVKTLGPKGERSIPMIDFHLAPGDAPQRESVLEQGELVTAVELQDHPSAANSHYLKIRDRASYEFALASVAAALEIHEGVVKTVRLALGGVATKPWRALEAERLLAGAKATPEAFAAAAQAALQAAKPRTFNAFKVELCRRAIVRALTTAGGGI